jgi:hypothetical protein
MSDSNYRLMANENIELTFDIGRSDIVVFQQSDFQQSNLNRSVGGDSEQGEFLFVGKSKAAFVSQRRSVLAAILISSQLNAAAVKASENFYSSVASSIEMLNSPHSLVRFEHLKPDIKPIDVSEESESKSTDKSELETIFKGLVKAWKEGTAGCSITTRRYAHGSYQAILVLGPDVVPLILRELQNRPDWWFEALKALTKKDPTNPTDNFHDAVKAWLRWGAEQKPPLLK